MAQFGSVALPF